MRFFNTTGPVVAADHYCVPPLERIDLSEILTLIADKRYFVLHAPRQTGKTSALLALRDLLNGGAHGRYRCVYVNVEVGQGRHAKTERKRCAPSSANWRSRRRRRSTIRCRPTCGRDCWIASVRTECSGRC